MTDIKRKALELVNAVRKEKPLATALAVQNKALCRAVERHEAFRQEVSDAVEKLLAWPSIRSQAVIASSLARFIIAKPDPLVEAWKAQYPDDPLPEASCADFRAAIEKRGGKIVWGEG